MGSRFGFGLKAHGTTVGRECLAGGRMGLTSVVVAALFALALFFTGIIRIVPAFATAPALVVVGIYMFRNIRHIDFSDFATAMPAFLTIVLMPLTYSISIGLIFGFLAYIAIALASGNARKLGPVLWIIGALSALELCIKAGLL